MNRRQKKTQEKQVKENIEEEESDDEEFQKKSRKTKNIGKKRKQQLKNKFFEIEADEGADSEDGGAKNGMSQAAKDAYYDASELKRRNPGFQDKIQEMEKRAQREDIHIKVKSKAYDSD